MEDKQARLDGIPCTTVARTLLDLADVVDRRGLERACERAEMLQLFALRAVEDALRRAAGRRGTSRLRTVLDEYRGETLTRSELEERLLAFCAARNLPRPRVNVWLALPEGDGYEADFLWERARLIAEMDVYSTHGGRPSFERDRRRDRRLKRSAGLDVVRLTPRQLAQEADEIAADLRERISGEGGIRTLEAA